MGRILSKALDQAAEEVANAMVPRMADAMARAADCEIRYDKGQWEAIIAAITEKMPHRLTKMPMTKEERLEILGAIDFLDRSVRIRGHDNTFKGVMRAMIGMRELSSSAAHFVGLKVIDHDGNDITEEIFG